MEASQHRCANCGNKFHGLCSNVRHPRADELQLTMGNDHLCPSCARIIFGTNVVPPLGSESTRSDDSIGSDDGGSTSDSTERLLSFANNIGNNSATVQQQNVIVDTSSKGRKQQHLVSHSLPPGVTVSNELATLGAKCHFMKQSKCKFKGTEVVICAKCENAVHIQCFLHLILDKKDNKVSMNGIHYFIFSFFLNLTFLFYFRSFSFYLLKIIVFIFVVGCDATTQP